jgi:hypothetical protein
MKTSENQSMPDLPAKKYAVFVLVASMLGLLTGLAAAELFLQYYDRHIARSERMEPGLILYDSTLGWKLAPGWTGTHRHHDFDVRYSIDSFGFRRDPRRNEALPRIAVLGC